MRGKRGPSSEASSPAMDTRRSAILCRQCATRRFAPSPARSARPARSSRPPSGTHVPRATASAYGRPCAGSPGLAGAGASSDAQSRSRLSSKFAGARAPEHHPRSGEAPGMLPDGRIGVTGGTQIKRRSARSDVSSLSRAVLQVPEPGQSSPSRPAELIFSVSITSPEIVEFCEESTADLGARATPPGRRNTGVGRPAAGTASLRPVASAARSRCSGVQ